MTDAAQSVAPGWVMPRRVVYVVDHSLPFSSDGYAVRTHEVARGLSELGHEVIVITRPGRPWDMKGFPKTRAIQQDRMLDGVRYVFLPHEGLPVSGLRNRQRAAERTLLSAFEIFRPGVVLAASSWENAEPAQYAARRWGVPFFFEQRGFWEMSEATRNPDYAQTPEFEATRQAELRVARAAAGVFTLNSAMKAELVRRGLEINKIHIAANGMRRSPASAIPVTREGVGSRAQHLIGYIGSLSPYEGTDVLIEALGHLRAGGLDVDALIVGSGNPAGLVGGTEADPFVSGVMAQATRAGLAEHVIHCPRVPQDQISGYYGILEAMVMPRRRSDMTELVAPMKPYAAAAHGVPVVMSDLPPLREIATDIDATLFAEGDAKALAARLRDLLTPNPSSVPAPTTPPITSAPAIPHALTWAVRMQAMSRILQQAVPMQRAAGAVFAQIQPGAATHSPNGHVAPVAGGQAALAGARFDAHILPQVVFPTQAEDRRVVVVGPGTGLQGARVTQASRASVLGDLATGDPGRFVIDWTGLQHAPGEWDEWDGLWSIENMRLNRQIMDAARIGMDRGWQMQVLGPVPRSRAPLFRTVSGVFEEVGA